MKLYTLPVKRRPASKGFFKRLRAVTGNRKQRVAAAATSDMEFEDSSSKISKALTIIFLIHIVAIGLIFFHQKFLDSRTPDEPKATKATAVSGASAAIVTPARQDLPRMASGEKPYIVRQGDNYANIARRTEVDEADLRLINKHVEIVPGLLLKMPPRREVAVAVVTPEEITEPAEPTFRAVTAEPEVAEEPTTDLVPTAAVRDVPRARLVKPSRVRPTEAAIPAARPVSATANAVASGKTHKVQSGDSIWKIANRYKVSQAALMKANGISDARKIKPGAQLVIPR